MTVNELAYGARQSSLDFWSSSRNKISDLYDSERHFFESVVKESTDILDVGCAAGGFSEICWGLNSNANYTGIDNVSDLIVIAREKRSIFGRFEVYNGHNLPFSENSFDLVYSFGVIHHLPHWESIIRQMFDVSRQYILFDVRLTDGPTLNDADLYYQEISFGEQWDGETKIPYIVINMDEMNSFLNSLSDVEYTIRKYGYEHTPTDKSNLGLKAITMMTYLVEKV